MIVEIKELSVRLQAMVQPNGSTDQVVVLVREDNTGLEGLGLLWCHLGVSHDNDSVANLHLTSCGTVQADASTLPGTGDDVCVKAFAIVVVHDVNSLAGEKPCGVHEVLVDGDAAHVVEVGLGDGCAVDFGFQYFNSHSYYFILL